jgi:hypothetical protein
MINDKLTRSNAFERSIFRITPFSLEDMRLFNPSWATPMASCIYSPFKKPNYSFGIEADRTSFMRLAMIIKNKICYIYTYDIY